MSWSTDEFCPRDATENSCGTRSKGVSQINRDSQGICSTKSKSASKHPTRSSLVPFMALVGHYLS